jgi:hypothetical protein
MMKVLDPTKKSVALWDRYALIHFKPASFDAPVLEPSPGLSCDIQIPLSAELLDRLGVQHVVEVDLATNEVPPGFHLAGTFAECRLLERD